MQDYINRQVEARARAWEEAKALLDHAAAEGRDLSASETGAVRPDQRRP
jgi:hypothetical protein